MQLHNWNLIFSKQNNGAKGNVCRVTRLSFQVRITFIVRNLPDVTNSII